MIDPTIVLAVEQVESGGKWWVESPSGCVGVMQVCPRWSKFKRRQLFDPNVNRAEGERILEYWLTRAHGEWHRALAAYNCGNAGLEGRCGQSYARTVWSLAYPHAKLEQGKSAEKPSQKPPVEKPPAGSNNATDNKGGAA